MKKSVYLNNIVKLALATLLVFLFAYYFKAQQINDCYYDLKYKCIQKYRLKRWFNRKALKNVSLENLHHGSAWGYLTAEEFKEIILDGISKMEPKIKKHEKIFELGVGVGAALKVIEDYIGVNNLEMWGLDVAENAITQVKKIFPKQSEHFFVADMTQRHDNIPDNYYDHVLSFGALAMYLTKDGMEKAIKEAVRITKPGGCLLFTAFIAPGGEKVGSIITPIETSFFEKNAKSWGVESVKIYGMKHQGDRYLVTFKKV